MLSFDHSLSIREHPQSTRNNSVIEKLMLEDASISELPSDTITLDETTLGYTCEDCKFKTTSKTRMDKHVKNEHEPNENE